MRTRQRDCGVTVLSTTGMIPLLTATCGVDDGKNAITNITPTENPKIMIASFEFI
jgi:hypothetical protein